MSEPDRIDDSPGSPGGTRPKAPLEFPRHDRGNTVNVWKVTLYFLLLVIVLAALVYWAVHPR